MRIKTYIPKKSDHGYKTYNNGIVGYDLPKGDYVEETLKKKRQEGLAFINKKGNWRVIKPLEKDGDNLVRDDKMRNLWDDIPRMAHLKSEKIGYGTQKPEAILQRIIACSTNEGDVVLDCFGGGGTTAVVSAKLNRKFITGDVSPVAVRVISDRLKGITNCPEFNLLNVPRIATEWLEMGGHTFAQKICDFMGWECNPKKSGDGGIDGWANKGSIPVQIKNHRKSIGRNPIKHLCSSLGRGKEGIFVAWQFTKTDEEYRVQVLRDEGKKITFITVTEILGSILISDEEKCKLDKLYKKYDKAA